VSRIDDLIREHCGSGVDYRTLGDLAVVRTGARPTDAMLASGGPIPYVNGGVSPSGHLNESNTPAETVTIPSRGSVGIIGYQAAPFWCGPLCYRVRSSTDQVLTPFLFFALKARERQVIALQQSGSIPALNKKELVAVRLPVPPIEVQREIVRVLSTFLSLQVELEAELGSRRRQYAYYRDSLLAFPESGDETRWVALGDIGSLFGGLTGKTKADFVSGDARYVSYMNVFENISTNVLPHDMVKVAEGERQRRLKRGDILFTGSSETPDECGMSSVLTTEPPEPLYLNSFCIGFRPDGLDLLDPEYAKHLFRSSVMRRQIVRTANGVTRFNVSKQRLAKVLVPIPPRGEQERVALILDKFDALVNDRSIGLPAELTARRKQYEHYRDRLLTFEEAA
jgi:type I restriction enzyme S subunit